MVLCKCGCGQELEEKPWHKWKHPKYIYGHGWNGRKHSEETKKKMRENHADFSGENHPLYGKYHSEETKKKISNNKERAKKIGIGHKNKITSEHTKRKLSISRKGKYCGEHNPNWQGGKSFEPYCPKFNRELKEEIRDRYDRKCFNCGKDEHDNINKLPIHHVYYNKEEGCNNMEFTLVPLCNSCHSKTNYNRKYWREYFLDKLTI